MEEYVLKQYRRAYQAGPGVYMENEGDLPPFHAANQGEALTKARELARKNFLPKWDFGALFAGEMPVFPVELSDA